MNHLNTCVSSEGYHCKYSCEHKGYITAGKYKYPEREAGQLKKGVGRINPWGFSCACSIVVVVAVDVMVIGAVILLVMVLEVV